MEHARNWHGSRWGSALTVRAALTMAAIAAVGCEGVIHSPAAGPGEGGGNGEGSNVGPAGQHSAPLCEVDEVGSSDLTRLSQQEYANTVRDLLGLDAPVSELPGDDKVGPFNSNAGAPVATLTLEVYAQLATDVAAEATSDVGSLVDCDPDAMGGETCAQQFIERFGERAYRRSLSDEELDNLLQVYSTGVDTGGFSRGIELVLRTMLQSPNLLYRIERGQGEASAGGTLKLKPHELASRLSYFLWNGPPDQQLLDAAARGELQTPEQVAAQTRRMLEDPRAERGIGAFFRQWLGLDGMAHSEKDAEKFPQYTPELGSAMVEETEKLATHIVQQGDARFETLMTASFSFVTPELAQLYDVEAPDAVEGEFTRIELDPEQRRGLLTQPSVMARFSHPTEPSTVHRGKMIRERLLCETVPPPPPDLNATLPKLEEDLTLREYMEQHTEVEACAGCHQLMDPIGFGFLSYDAIGQYREMVGDRRVDDSGKVVDVTDRTTLVQFEGAAELAEWLATNDQAKSCFVQQWVTYALGRTLSEEERCLLERLRQEHVADGELNVRQLVVDVTTSRAFRHRRIPEQSGDEG